MILTDADRIRRPALAVQAPERTLDQRRRRFEKWVILAGGVTGALLFGPVPDTDHPFAPALRYPAGFLAGAILGAGLGHLIAPVFVRE